MVEPARAALLGPVRVIPKEFPEALCRSIDLDRNIQDLRKAASDVIAECFLRGADSCVAYRQSERWVETFESTSLRAQTSGTRLKEKGVYLIVGGLGGIGLVVAEHLARTVHARLVLVGRTPLPPASEWQAVLGKPNGTNSARQKIAKLREIESLGAEVLTLSADVTDAKQIAEALRMARQRFGNIHGVIHAAGLIEDGPLQIKARESAARVLAPKIQGTLALQHALGDSKLDFLLLFSSISSLAPPAGQVDYAAANAFLDAFATSKTGQPVTAVNWGLWTDVGMASRDVAGSYPILGRRLVQTATETVYSARLSCERNWLLSEHRFKNGAALIPGTGYLQLAAAALINDGFAPGVDFEDVFFLAPLTVAPDETREVRVRLRRESSGFRFSILAKEKEWTEYASGQIGRNQKSVPADQDVAEIRLRCSSRCIDFNEKHRTRQERYFDFGPRWRNLQTLHIGEREALAELQLGRDFAQDIETWPVHPALLDLATGSALYLIQGYEESDALYLPLSYKRITLYRPLPARFYSHIRCRQENTAQREIATFSFTLLDVDGRVLGEIDEFALRRMATTADSPAPVRYSRAPGIDSEPADSMLDQGMASADGIRAFDQILSSDMPPGIIVVRGDLRGKPAGPLATASPPRNTAKPEGEIESVIAEWWQELLGVEKAGLDDDFFDLGGHSLVGVRLFAKIKKTYQVDLDLAALFEARTIRQLAGVIRKSQRPATAEVKTWSALVPIQPNGSRVPIFCVHALGPSLLFYRQLATYLGPDQPFYALQSPLESQVQTRQPSLEELASIYIKELQNFFPEGPYLLGGASLGGFIALEMSQQLYAQGKKTGLLILFDAEIPESNYRVTTKDQISRHWQNVRNQGAVYLLQRAVSKSEYYWSRLLHSAQAVGCSCYRLVGRSLPAGLRYFQVEEAHKQALERYTVQLYPGKITLLRAADVPETVGTRRNPTLGWEILAGGGLEIHDVPGGHISMFEEPNVRILAETLKAILPSESDSQPKNETAEKLSLVPR